MLPASAANSLASSSTNNLYENILNILEKKIYYTSLNGSFDYTLYYSEHKFVVTPQVNERLSKFLGTLGYSVTYTQFYITVKWG